MPAARGTESAIKRSLALTLLVPLALLAATPALARASVRVERQGDRLTVVAEGVARAVVLGAVAGRLGIELIGLEAVPEEPVSVRLERVPVLEALRRLLGPVPALVVAEPAGDGARVVLVRVFGRRAGGEDTGEGAVEVQTPAAARGRDLAALEAGSVGVLRAALLDPGDDERAAAALEVLERRDPARAVRELLLAARSDDAAERLHALRLLHRSAEVDRATAVAAFGAAVHDDDEGVRAFAVSALATRGAGALGVLRRVYREAAAPLRMMVLQAVVERDPATPLLGEALADADPGIRAFAAFRLGRTEEEGGV